MTQAQGPAGRVSALPRKGRRAAFEQSPPQSLPGPEETKGPRHAEGVGSCRAEDPFQLLVSLPSLCSPPSPTVTQVLTPQRSFFLGPSRTPPRPGRLSVPGQLGDPSVGKGSPTSRAGQPCQQLLGPRHWLAAHSAYLMQGHGGPSPWRSPCTAQPTAHPGQPGRPPCLRLCPQLAPGPSP